MSFYIPSVANRGSQIVGVCLAFCLTISVVHHCHAQGRSRANSRQIDPVRPEDDVEVKWGSKWYPGIVVSFSNGKATVDYQWGSHARTGEFSTNDMRFPNGEGHWTIWKDASGKFKVEARFITRDETSVMIRKADGSELTIPIEKLSLDLRQRVKQTPIPGNENQMDGANPVRVGDRIQAKFVSTWYDGVVTKVLPGEVEVETDKGSTRTYALKDIRFPNGEGRWREWSDASGEYKIIARYISRTATEVTIRKEDGSDLTLPIDRLSGNLKRLLKETPVTGEETMIDGANPIRVGDKVQVKSWSTWYDGVIKQSLPGAAVVEYKWHSSTYTKEFKLEDVRYPNGEGHWRLWSDASGSFQIKARYIVQNATSVTLMKEDGSKINVPIERLSSKLRRMVEQTLAMTPAPPKVEFGMSPKLSSFMSTASTFSQATLSGIDPPPITTPSEGGFGFGLTHGDKISAAIPIDGWIVVGTYATKSKKLPRLTRLYWTKPGERKVVEGPNFQTNQRIVDYSAAQQRLITVQVSEGHWEQPEMFCSYRVAPGEKYAKPEAAWDIAEKKRSYGRGSSYQASLVGDNQLLLADGNAVSLYDFGSRKIEYSLSGLKSNYFALHPSKNYFAVSNSTGLLSLHRTSTGEQVAGETIPSIGSYGFSADGTKMIHVGGKDLSIWDLTRDAEPRLLNARNLPGRGRMVMLNDDWIWANSYMYNTAKEIIVWRYSGSSVTIARSDIIGDRMLVAGIGGSHFGPKTALIGIAKVPHKEVVDATADVDAGLMTMLKPGTGVRIEAPGDRRIREGLMRTMQANGWVEDPSSEVVFSGSAKSGEQQELTYESSRFGFGFGARNQDREPKTIKASPWIQSASISFRGQRAWSASSGGLPYSVVLREGETLDGEVRKATKPNYGMFEKLTIPAEMLYPQYKNGFGETLITPNGFKDKIHNLGEAPNSGKPGKFDRSRLPIDMNQFRQ